MGWCCELPARLYQSVSADYESKPLNNSMEIPMKKILCALSAILFLLTLGPVPAARADADQPGYYDAGDQDGGALLSPEELDDLLAPIALYPDPLIAQILPAATFLDQIDEAARYLRQYGKAAPVDAMPWDVSVKAVAHYPDVLFMMDQKNDWTASLGQAFLDQPQDVMDSIQQLRADAMAQGNLFSTREQQIISDQDGIRIVPATPDYVYVPVYDPQTVYLERYDPTYPFISFGIGFAIGAWLSRDFDWHNRRVYYHGWQGGGWISRSRPHIHDRGGVYINKRSDVINLNHRVLQHDTSRFRQELRNDTQRRGTEHRLPTPAARAREPRPVGMVRPHQQGVPQQRLPEAGREPRTPEAVPQQRLPEAGRQRPAADAGRQAAPTVAPARPPVNAIAPKAQPATRDVFRGRDQQRDQPAVHTGYGGYGSPRDANSYRQRGQASQENMRQFNRPGQGQPPRPSAAPAPRAAAPAPRATAPAPRAVAPAPAPRAPAPAAPKRERQQ